MTDKFLIDWFDGIKVFIGVLSIDWLVVNHIKNNSFFMPLVMLHT